ncbi:cation:proton antiporter [Actinomadura barringtoniae]|uniref:Cation:proton antiporter n=1 Tax=Actinomadura barringtoniae TaxID=1427535 RepID=A0A939PU96_9ACTN|nr:cation:proton antiporter [Actinomadura barringtoniae]MBO2455149.1 cation:proton antiporter [Actinomadura barringtoniae]
MSSSAYTFSAVAIVAAGVVAPRLSDAFSRWIPVPSVVLEIVLGILIGPVVLGWAKEGPFIGQLADFGLAVLMFLAGYEIEFDRIRGGPLKLAVSGWLVSLCLGLGAGLLFQGWDVLAVVVGLCLTTTALGTILPMLHDAGALPTPFGARAMAIGALGECGPIVAIAVLLGGDQPAKTITLLAVFAVITVTAAIVAVRGRRNPQVARMIRATLTTSAQLAIRLAMFMIVLMLWIADSFGLDVLLGAFAAGIIERLAIEAADSPRTQEVVKSKLEAIGYGFLVPFFFVVSGMRLDLAALAEDPWDLALIPLFLLLFLVVRGGPTMLLHRRDLPSGERRALSLLASSALPLVVVITTLGVEEHNLKPSIAAALVCAGMLSVLIFPLVALRLREYSVRGAGLESGDAL